jgi:predicted phage terminase large subunit-like protein
VTVDYLEVAARAFEPGRHRHPTPGALARVVNPRTVDTPALRAIDQALVELSNTPDGRLIVCMPPQEGKSVRVSGDFPTWLLQQNPDRRVVVASYGKDLATRNGRAIRNRITQHPTLGLTLAPDQGAAHEWTIAGREGGVLSVGIGSGLTGRPADVMVIDDPIKDRTEADSKTYRDRAWDWWTEVARTRLAPGAPVVLVLTRWHHDDLAGRLLAQDAAGDGDGWTVLTIPAEADHHPENGETDPLGRAPGEFMVSARGRTPAQWERIKRGAGARTWAALYQGKPSPDEGSLFLAEWWQEWDLAPYVVAPNGVRYVPEASHSREIELCQSWDMAFKDKDTSDFVVGQVWLRRGVDAYLLEQVRGRWSFTETCRQVKALSRRWPQAVAKLVEDAANGPAVMNALRATVSGLIPVTPEGSKYARAAAISPLVQSGNVLLPPDDPEADQLVEEAKAFPHGANDDQVDALSQALHRLLLVPMFSGDLVEDDDFLDDDDDADDYAIAPA